MLLRICEQMILWRVCFEMFHRTFLLFHIHIEQFSVTSVRCFILLLLLRRLIPICPRNWYRVPVTKPLASIFTALTITLYPSFPVLFWDLHMCNSWLFRCKRSYIIIFFRSIQNFILFFFLNYEKCQWIWQLLF